jgi:predicted heme/steroid binding protein
MDSMLEAPEHDDMLPYRTDDGRTWGKWWQSLQAASTRRALLLTALGGLLIAGLITAFSHGGGPDTGLSAGSISLGPRGNDTFDHVKPGDCLNWPGTNPDAAHIVACKDEHRFEVAESIDMKTFPGTEYGPNAAPPSKERVAQISQEQCTPALRSYLGPKFDPNGKFTIGLLWSGEKAWKQSGERRMLCGLQLLGPGDTQLPFQGNVADIDQSKVWAAGTCLGIDAATNQPTDVPVDCTQPHAMEVTGAVNLAEKFPGGLPADPDQDAFIKDTCTKLTDAYLAPVQLRATTLALSYSTISLPSWSAGSHQVSCNIGATLGNGGWSTLLNTAKGALMINGQPPVAPPDIPEERLNLPSIPLPDASSSASQSSSSQAGASSSNSGSSSSGSSGSSSSGTQTQHLPQQPAASTAAPAPAPQSATNPPPPAPPAGDQPAPPPPGDQPPPAGDQPPVGPPPGPAVPLPPPLGP